LRVQASQTQQVSIGRAVIDMVNFVGTVYDDEGIVFAGLNRAKTIMSVYQVLTCVTSD
jgi:hypothetical protein